MGANFQKAFLAANSAEECFLLMEKDGLMGRLDPDGNRPVPQIFKGPVMDRKELGLMRSVQNVVRMGRATAIEENKIVLESGSIDFSSDDTLLVDCMVDNLYGYNFPEDTVIFEPGRINLGPLTFLFNVSASSAHIAFLECTFDDDESKNDLCYFPRGEQHTAPSIQNFVGAFYLQMKCQEAMKNVPGGGKFLLGSRTNLNAPMHHKGGLLRFLWFLYGPKRAIGFSKKLYKKVESRKYSDVDDCFGIETFRSEQVAI